MGEHFLLLLIISATGIYLGRRLILPNHGLTKKICHDEDQHSNMETPCCCRGTLKYAHRECIQRWCNEKGDAICEICREDFKPGYTAPPPSFHSGEIPFQLRQSWELFRTDPQTPHFMTMVPDDDDSIESDFYDYPIPPLRSLMCCRAVAIIFVVLLLLRYTLPIISYDVGEYPMALLMVMMFKAIGILLSIYIVMRTLAAARCRRRHQDDPGFHVAPLGVDEESDIPHLQQETRPRFMQVH